jgi:hypothetical protein
MIKRLLGLFLLLVVPILGSACDAVEVPLPGARRTLFHDEFVQGSTGNWLLESDELGSSVIVPEQMLIELNAPNVIQYTTLTEPAFSDFILEVEAGLNNGSLASSYGVLFRMQGPEEFYRFSVTGDGMYILERHGRNGAVVRFTENWRGDAGINKGHGSSNILKIEADGPRIAVYVNDNLLEEVRDDSLRAGKVALSAGTFDGAGIQAFFDNLAVYPTQ